MVGTSVRDSPYEAISASTTFTASGVKMYFAEPESKVTGTNTMQIDIVEISAGTATCSALSRIAEASGLFCSNPRFRWVFSISTVASSTSMPTASAKPPSDITLIVCPSADETAMANNAARGSETHNQCAPPAAEKDQDHQGSQDCCRDGLLCDVPDRCTHDHRLVEDRGHCQRRRQPRLDLRDRRFYLVHDGEGGSRAILDHRQKRRSLAIFTHVAGLRL